MGTEIKLTDGLISSRTGFQGNVSQYQISAPVQSGNSGGPLFDNNGNLIGIINAKHNTAENVSYAVKLSYLKNLIETTNEIIPFNYSNGITSYNLQQKVKTISPFVVLIKVNDTNNKYSQNYQDDSTREFINPYVKKQNESYWGNANVKAIEIGEGYTIAYFEYITPSYVEGGWISMSSTTNIIANNGKYSNRIISWCVYNRDTEEFIDLDLDKKYSVENNNHYMFYMRFSELPEYINNIDIIENIEDKDGFNWIGISLSK